MTLSSLRPTLITAHRWVGLVLSPIFLLIILSGAVLAFRPILAGSGEAPAAISVDVAALTTLVQRLDSQSPLTSVAVVDGGAAIDAAAADPAVAGRWRLADGSREAAATAKPVDVFAIAESLHKQLLVGLGLIVEIASWAMTVLVIVGPFLTWLRFRNTLLGWHTALGWCLFPLVLLAPLTGVLMTLHVGEGGTPLPRATRTVPIAEALGVAARDADLSGLAVARRFRGGTVMMQVRGAAGGVFVVTETAATRLVGGPSLVKQIHEGTWAGAWSGLLNFGAAIVLLILTVTGTWSWIARRHRDRLRPVAVGADVLVAHASQTGTAARLAEATARALTAGGETAAVAPLGTLTPKDLRAVRQLLLVASTTGEGDIPDGARRFAESLAPGDLTGVPFAVLALGDRSYANFCGGGDRLRTVLTAAGAKEAMLPARADRDPAPTWRRWLEDLDVRLGLRVGAVGEVALEAAAVPLRLAERRRLDDPAAGDTQETWSVTLASDTALDFRPGDLLRLAPVPGARERSYSIGSSSRLDPRRIVLTVKLHRWSEGRGSGTGVVSGLLCRSTPIGGTLEGRVTPHPSFRPPEDASRPIVMIATGTGIAPFPGFLAERRASGKAGPAWLVFGNRHAKGDFLWREAIERARTDGTLTRLDTAFSRDADDGARVPARLATAAAELCRWLDDGALVYLCGRRAMVDDVLAVIATALVGHRGLTPAAARAEVDRRIAEDLVRIDAFE